MRESESDFAPALQKAARVRDDWLTHFATEAVKSYNLSSLERFVGGLRIWKVQDPLNSTERYGNKQALYALSGRSLFTKVPIYMSLKRNSLNLKF